MGTSLTGTTPQDTYDSLIKVTDNGPLSATAKYLSDGLGNDSALSLSTDKVGIGTNAPSALLNVQNSSNGVLLARFKDNISAATYLDIKTDATLTDYTALYFGSDRRIMSKQGGTLFLNCGNTVNFVDGLASKMVVTPSEVQIGTISGARLAIKGSGSTSATTALLVQNSAGSLLLRAKDDGQVQLGSSSNFTVDGNTTYNRYELTVGGLSSIPSAILSATSTTRGFLPPRMTTTQRDAIATPATGLKVYNTTTNTTDTYDGATWQRFGQQTLIKGSGTTSATTSFLVQNSSGFNAIQVTDDLKVNINSLVFGGSNGYIGINNNPNIDSALRAIRTDSGTSPLYISSGEVGVGDGTTYASAIFAIGSTTRGFLPPRMTTTQKNAISSPASGLQVYDTDLNQMSYYNGTTWTNI
jgi:hypothetical protein